MGIIYAIITALIFGAVGLLSGSWEAAFVVQGIGFGVTTLCMLASAPSDIGWTFTVFMRFILELFFTWPARLWHLFVVYVLGAPKGK